MQLRHLRYILAVADAGSLRAAERRLNVSQSALSRRIREVEAELGFDLFRRDTTGVVPTAAGAAFAADVRLLLTGLAAAEARASDIARREKDRIRFAVSRSATRLGFVQKGVQRYSRIAAGQSVNLQRMSIEQIALVIATDPFDAVLAYSELVDLDGYETVPVHVEQIVVAMPLGHPLSSKRSVTLSELADSRFVWPPRASSPRRHDSLMAACARQGFVPQIQWHTDSLDTLDVVRSGQGCAFVSSSTLLRADFAQMSLKPVADLALPMHLVLAWRKGVPGVEALVEAFRLPIAAHRRLLARDGRNWASTGEAGEGAAMPASGKSDWLPIT